MTYLDLDARANRLARMLVDNGAERRSIVCIGGAKQPATFVAIVACLKMGATYVILDPESPAERLQKIVSRCRPRLMLGDSYLLAKLNVTVREIGARLLEITADGSEGATASYSSSRLRETDAVIGTDPAYIMFTSGSTGFPKGAVMTHANVLNLIHWARTTYAIVPEDIQTNVNPLYFDNSVFDLYSSLFNGASMVPFTREETADPGRLVAKVEETACTLWFSVPSLLMYLQTMKALDGTRMRSIRRFVFGGEGYPKAKLKQLYDAYGATAELHNVYGPTECTCICSSYRLRDEDFRDLQGLPPLGQIAPNFDYLVLDEADRRVPDGEIGELCLLGPNVARGYYNDPERTARSFVRNPYGQGFEELMYRTGDLVRQDPADGKLYVHGRKDSQIKHMGYRIELEEIEAALHCLEYISEAVVVHSTHGGLSRIMGIVVCKREIGDEEIRRDLGRIVPAYMVPGVFMRETVLPKNANGKIDRRQLAEMYVGGKTENA